MTVDSSYLLLSWHEIENYRHQILNVVKNIVILYETYYFLDQRTVLYKAMYPTAQSFPCVSHLKIQCTVFNNSRIQLFIQ